MTQSVSGNGEVFLGGGVEQAAEKGIVDLDCTNDTDMNEPALDHLRSVLPSFFEGAGQTTLKQAWTGIMGFTPDGFPIVGKVPTELSPVTSTANSVYGGEWIAAGFNGYGMVHCWQSGKAIADMILGVADDVIDEYLPRQLFECSAKRLESMKFEELHAAFHKNYASRVRSNL